MLAYEEREICVSEPRAAVVLCVDDDPIALMSRRLLLEGLGYEVLVASSGSSALQIVRGRRVDLVLTDHFMPEMTGAELVATLKLEDPKIPAVILTGAQEPPPGSEQADLVLIKGADPQKFLTEIAKFLAERIAPAETSDDPPNSQQ